MRGARLRHGMTGGQGWQNKEVVFPMAQSKKQLLKLIHRRCQKAGRALAYTAYKVGDVALLDASILSTETNVDGKSAFHLAFSHRHFVY